MPGERRVRKKEIIGVLRSLSIASFVLLCDQAAKIAVQRFISPESSVPVIKNIFHLTLVFNRGAAFGMLKTHVSLFIAVGIAAAVFIIYYIPRIKSEDVYGKITLSLLLGGILGNLIDRIRFGHVIDFLDFRIWPVFNIADSAITIATALLCFRILRRKQVK